MTVSAKQLDKLFNSSSNDVDDNELKALHEKAGGKSEDNYDGGDPEIDEALSTGSGQSFSEKSKKNKKKAEAEADAIDDCNIEDFDLVVEDDNDDDGDISAVIGDKKEKPSDSGGRVPFDFDGIDDEEDDEEDEGDGEDEEDSAVVSSDIDTNKEPAAVRAEREEVNKIEHIDQALEPEPKSNDEEISDFEYDREEENAIRDQLMKVCKHEEYLDDSKYLLFYREKLRAVNFLERSIPHINFKKLEKEIQLMHVKVDEEKIMSLDEFNLKIQQIQSLRNRLSKIRSLSIRDYVLRKRVVKLLEECLNKQSSERSNDKRMGEVQIHMADMEYRLAMSEAFYKDIEQIMDNIACAHEALSRQITCMQERNKEISRGGEPYVEPKQEERWDAVSQRDKKHGYTSWDKIV